MTTNFSFVTHTTKGNAHKVTLHGMGNRFHKCRLTHTRRAHQAKNRSATFGTRKLQDRHVFHNAFFHLIKAKMLGVQFALHLLHVENGVGVFAIRQAQEPIQIVAAHGVFRRRRLHQAHAANFFFKLFLNGGRELFRLDFLEQLVRFRRISVFAIQFILQLADLFANEPFLLLLGHFLAHVLLHLDHHGIGIGSHLHNFNQAFGKLIDFANFEQTLTFIHRNLQEGNHAIKSVNLAVHGKQRVYHAFRNIPMHGIFLELRQHRFKARALVGICNRGLMCRNCNHQEVVLGGNRTQIDYTLTFKHHLHATIREGRYIAYMCKDTHRVQVEHRVFNFFLLNIFLCRKNYFAIVRFSIFKSA